MSVFSLDRSRMVSCMILVSIKAVYDCILLFMYCVLNFDSVSMSLLMEYLILPKHSDDIFLFFGSVASVCMMRCELRSIVIMELLLLITHVYSLYSMGVVNAISDAISP